MSSVFELVAARHVTIATRASFEALDIHAPKPYRELAAIVANYCRERDHRVIGLGGGQGAGKSTLSALIRTAVEASGERSEVLGLDDFYLAKAERRKLAADQHELFATRGPPGTHDIQGLLWSIDEINAGRAVTVPQFEKGLDDRVNPRRVEMPVDRLVVEGWCVGASPQREEDLRDPINLLERERDADRSWRTKVNAHLEGDYARLLERLDCFIYLRVPHLQSVERWRLQQEQDRAPEQRKDAEWITDFVQYYQRITEWMREEAPSRADVLVELDVDHGVKAVVLR